MRRTSKYHGRPIIDATPGDVPVPVAITVSAKILRENAQLGLDNPAIEFTTPAGTRLVRSVAVRGGIFTTERHADNALHVALKGSAKVWFETDSDHIASITE
ncbi:MAG: hypothetical protein C4555_06400 [Dehalococcoidia bacterium]|nr:MAG: hypothetical protein C4555_06400 [Dehalococcoidia bacterium]